METEANLAFNYSFSLSLKGDLDLELFKKSVYTVIQRHESLRMTFSKDGENLLIAPSLTIDIPVINLSKQEPENEIIKIKKQVAEEPFNLEKGPLFRGQIIQLKNQEYLAIFSAHHIICDGNSWWLLISDLGKIYSALKQGLDPQLEPADSFSEYAILEWQKNNDPQQKETEEFWVKQFTQSVPVLDLPTDKPRPSLRTFNSAREDFILSPQLYRKLKQFGIKHGCTFMTTMLAGFEVFLNRITGQEDVITGVPSSIQAFSGKYNLLGHCVNLLPIRAFVSPEQTFTEYLNMRKGAILDAYDHQDFTFGRLLQKLTIKRDQSRIPLVPITFFVGHNTDFSFGEELETEVYSNPLSFNNFEISIYSTVINEKVILECQYNTNLFSAETIRYRLAEFERLLTSIVENEDLNISHLPLLPESEKALLQKWNETATQEPNLCVNQLFETQVTKTPEKIAVIFEDQKLTYQELNEKANQLAHHLRKLGVKPDVLVGFCLERSLEMIIGVLGILKAGGAYVPIDLNYPTERIDYMLENSQVGILLTQNHLQEKLKDFSGHQICLDTDWQEIAQENKNNPPHETTLNHLIYVIYTSGSTGKPKGVLLNHYALANLIKWQINQTKVSPQAKTLQFSPISFDVSCQEIFATLSFGGTLVLISEEQRQDFNLLTNYVEKQGIERLFIPFVGLQLFTEVANLNSHTFPHLKEIITAGEQLKLSSSIRTFFKRLNHCTLHNQYGPSESHVVTAFTLPSDLDQCTYLVPIGFPINNTQIYILDSYLKPVPIGLTGELYIGGKVIARGYLNREDLTKEKFISNPFGTGKLYKTGDLARYLPDGNIQYIGRIDNQLKIRGFRIELGEIEATLNQYEPIQESVVIATENQRQEKSIVAYYIAKNNANISLPELKEFLKQKLPEYMIPSVFIPLEIFPLSPNGKVDRKALPKPEDYRLKSNVEKVLPRTETEQKIAKIWRDLLDLKQVDIHDDFFDLGGNSVLSISMVARLSKLFEITFPVKTFFQMPTIAQLATRIETIIVLTKSSQILADQLLEDEEEGMF